MTKKATSRPQPKTSARTKQTTKVDYYPNRMTLAVSAAAAVSLTLIGVMASMSQ